MRKPILFILALFFLVEVEAQIRQKAAPDDKSVTIPYRPRIAEISYNQLSEYNVRSNSGEFGNADSEIQTDRQLKIRLGVPIIMNGKDIFGVQLKYDHHNFLLDFEDSTVPYALYDHMQTKHFTSLGARFIYRKSLDDSREITIIAGAEIKSDVLKINKNTAKYYAHFAYSKRLSDRTKIGGGFLVSYTLGSPQIYPLFCYEHQFNTRWTLDLKLPKQAAIRYKVNERFYVTTIAEIKGWRYAIHNTALSPQRALSLQKTDIHFGFRFEHEIHDWLWLGVDTGISKNLRYYLAEPGDNRWDALIGLTPRDAPYLNIGLFIVPPRNLYR